MAVSTIDALYNGTSEKLTTSATGIDVTGTVTSDGLTVTQTGSTTATIGATGTSGDNDGTLIINNGGTGDGMLRFDYESATDRARIGVSASSQNLQFYTAGNNERMRIDSSGNVGIGTDSPSQKLHVYEAATNTQAYVTVQNNRTRNSAVLTQTTNGGYYTGTSIGTDTLCWQVYQSGTGERMRIDSSGNLLVNTTNPDVGFSSTAGSALHPTGQTHHSSAGTAIVLNRTTSDGVIANFRRNGSSVGYIGSHGGTNLTIYRQAGLQFTTGYEILPNRNGNPSDNIIDLGSASYRFDDIRATNGTIQTSDFNEKQDIASLTATEMLVGKRISVLFKTFRWKDAVAKKGDDARTHTGIIAQDVQAAFTAEGLDAGDYALFISDTWWEIQTEVPAVEAVEAVEAVTETTTDEEGNEVVTVTTEAVEAVEAVDAYTRTDTYETEAEAPEGATSKTRLGIRYPELLSFVAAYNEQRFASIEARLTALEA